MDSDELLFLLADDQIKARARELIGAERHSFLLAQAALGDSSEKLDPELVAKLLSLSKSGAAKRIQKTRPKPRQ